LCGRLLWTLFNASYYIQTFNAYIEIFVQGPTERPDTFEIQKITPKLKAI